MTTTEARFENVPLDRLHESPLNPRKHFDAAALAELASSLKASGIITPLLVRPNAKGFEIAAGHRRYRAAKLVALAEAPCVIREMDDAEFVEVLNIENLQRQDMTPLEEADGYRLLMTKAGYTVEKIADRIGMSVKYVYDRVKLLQLIPAAQQELREGRIATGHAILLARLKPSDQERALDQDSGGVFEHEETLFGPEDEDESGLKARSVRELEAWIAGHVRFRAAEADPFLFPDAVAAAAQTPFVKARGRRERVVEITHQSIIQPEARDGKTIRAGYWQRADGREDSKPCESAVTGVIVVGPGQGEAFKVCVDREHCTVHWAKEIKAKAAPHSGGSGPSAKKPSWQIEQEKRHVEEVKREAERLRWTKAKSRILEAMAAAVKKAPTKAGGLLAQIVVDAVNPRSGGGVKASDGLVPRGKTADDLLRYAAFIVLVGEASGWQAPEAFPKRAKAFGVDVVKIVDAIAPRAALAAASAKKPQTLEKKKATPS